MALVTQLFETQQIIPSEPFGRRDTQRKKIQLLPVAQEFEMKVRAGCMTGLSDVSDNITFLHWFSVTDAFGESGKMRVAGQVPRRMADLYGIAVTIAPAGKLYPAPTDGHRRRPFWRRIVNGLMRTHGAGDRM